MDRASVLAHVPERNGRVMEGTEPWSQQAAWQALLALRPRLRRFASGLTGSLDEADDLVQAVYERAVERHLQWEPGTRFHSWVFKIAHSLWISRQRHAAVRRPKGAAVDPDTLVGSDGERDAHARLALADVRRLVAKLPTEQRAALMLVAVDGASYADAAEILSVPPGTVASRVARARLALIEALEGREVDASSTALARSG
jgi:RNA polymerase sigma-70 factor (ECF subfamily)